MSEEKDIKTLIEDQGKAWDEFKKTNDARLQQIEENGVASADLEEKLAKINGDLDKIGRDLDEVSKKANRQPAPDGKSHLTDEEIEYKAGLVKYIRTGREDGLRELEGKALITESDPDGGYLVDTEMDSMIDRVASTITGLREIATVRTIGAGSYKKFVKTRGISGGWLDENASSSEDAGGSNLSFSEIEIRPSKIYAEPWISNEMLEDAFYDLEADITDEAGITFREVEGSAFITGNGVKKPRGITSYDAVANASYEWGKVGYIASGAAGAFATSAPADKLISLQHALRQQYRPGARWLMSDTTLGVVRQFKDASGAYYMWQPDTTAGFGGRLLGSPVSIDDYMPAIAANSLSVAYGNFARGYTIVDRRGTALIRDNVTKKGVTKMHLSRRVGGGIVNFEAIKFLRMATS